MILIDQIPKKSLFKVQEVCELCQIKPYVLRFWDSEFDQIQSVVNSSGKKLYQKKDILVISVLKDLLFDRKLTIEKARHELSMVDFEKVVQDQVSVNNAEELSNLETDVHCSDNEMVRGEEGHGDNTLKNLQLSFEDQEKVKLARTKLNNTLDFINDLKFRYNWV